MQATLLYPLAGLMVLGLALALYALTLALQRRERLAYAHYHEEVRGILPWSYLWALPLLCLALAAAGLSIEREERVVRCRPFLLVLDVSKSMRAEDASRGRSRIDAAKDILDRLVEACPDTAIGLLTYAGRVTLWTSGTLDHRALREEILAPWIPGEFSLPKGGSRLDTALGHAAEMRKRLRAARAASALTAKDSDRLMSIEPPAPEALVLVSDGGTSGGALEALIAHARALEAPIHALGVGGETPVTIPIYKVEGTGRRITDVERLDGAPILTTYSRIVLERLAEETGGVYAHERDPRALVKLLDALKADEPTAMRVAPRNLFQYCTAAALGAITLLLGLTALSQRESKREKTIP
jgi:hypothetical protein